MIPFLHHPDMTLRARAAPIGRAVETATLERAINETRAGGKRALVIRGAAGMGKTTLLYWVQGLAQDSGFSTALARAPAAGGLPPRFPVAELLGDLAEAAWIDGAHVPDLVADTIDALRGVRGDAVQPPNLLQIARALEQVALEAPIAAMLDDLQWAPRDELNLLLAALRLAEVPALFVATERTDAVKRPPYPVEAAADLPVDLIDLQGLSPDSVSELASRAIGAPVLPSLCRAVHARTLGNPLFIKETLRSWQDSGEISVAAGGYWGLAAADAGDASKSLLEVIGSRLEGMPAAPLAVAQALAILGGAGTFDELKRILGLTSDALVEALGTLDDLGIVTRETDGTERLAHPLFQSSLLAAMGRTREGAWHGRVYGALRLAASDRSASELAYHAVRAIEPPEDLDEILRAAVAEAQRSGSYAEAADWYESLAQRLPDGPALAEALAGRAAALEHFDPAAASSVYGEAIRLADEETDRARLLLGRARAFRMAGQMDEALDDLHKVSSMSSSEDRLEIRHAIAVMTAARGDVASAAPLFDALAQDSVGTAVHAKAVGHSATVAYVQGRLRDAKALSIEALAECEDPSYRAYLEMNLCWYLVALGEWTEAESLLQVCIDRATRAHDIWFLVPLLSSASRMYTYRGEIERALDLGTENVRIAKHGNPIDRITSLGGLGNALVEAGNFDEAVTLLHEIPSLVKTAPEKSEVIHALTVLGEAYLLVGDTHRVAELLTFADPDVRENLLWEIALERLQAQLDLATGNNASVVARTERYIEEPSPFVFEQARVTEISAHALWAQGDLEAARVRASEALASYEKLGASLRVQRLVAWMADRHERRPGRPRLASPGSLTEREIEILRLIAAGMTNGEIASRLTISAGTVKKHVENMKSKLGVRRRTELAIKYSDLAT